MGAGRGRTRPSPYGLYEIDARVDCGIMGGMNEEPDADDVSLRALMIVVVRFLRFLARWCERRYVTMR